MSNQLHNTASVLARSLRHQSVSMYLDTLKMHKNNEDIFLCCKFLIFLFSCFAIFEFYFGLSRPAKNKEIKMFRKIKKISYSSGKCNLKTENQGQDAEFLLEIKL